MLKLIYSAKCLEESHSLNFQTLFISFKVDRGVLEYLFDDRFREFNGSVLLLWG